MNTESGKVVQVHTFRESGTPTIISVAPRAVVHAIFGGLGVFGLAGLERAFGGGIAYENQENHEAFLGVWGRRNASRFRSLIRQSGYQVKLIARFCGQTGFPNQLMSDSRLFFDESSGVSWIDERR